MQNEKQQLKTKKTKIFRFSLFAFRSCRRQAGFTLLFSLLVVSVILSVSLGISNIMTKELKLSGIGRESQIAFYAADVGIECFFYWEIKHPGLDDSAFEPADAPSDAFKCAESSFCAISDANPDTNKSSYSFTLPFGAPTNSCVEIKVDKNYSISNKVITTVESRGYNVACDSDSPFKVERAIRLVSVKEL